MREHISRNLVIYNILLSLFQSFVLGIYLAIYTDKLIKGSTFLQGFISCGYYNILFAISIILLIMQIKVGMINKSHEKNQKEILINEILKSACKTLVYPDTHHSIRSCVTICNYKTGKRVTRYSYNLEADPERTAIVDIDFGITGDAIKRKVPVAGGLRENHMDDYPPNNGKYICPDIRCVLAAPIFSKKNQREVIGVLAFDSFETLEEMKFNTHQSKEIAQMWADILSDLI